MLYEKICICTTIFHKFFLNVGIFYVLSSLQICLLYLNLLKFIKIFELFNLRTEGVTLTNYNYQQLSLPAIFTVFQYSPFTEFCIQLALGVFCPAKLGRLHLP